MQTIYFRSSASPGLMAQQEAMRAFDSGAFAAAVHVDLYRRQKVIAQIPGPGLNAIKVLPPVTSSLEDIHYFLTAFEDTISRFYQAATGPLASLAGGAVQQMTKQLRDAIPGGSMPELIASGLQAAAAVVSPQTSYTSVEEKKTPLNPS